VVKWPAIRDKLVMSKVMSLPRAILATIRCYRILSGNHGHFRSTLRWQSVDQKGNPLPWYTYPAIEYLAQLDLTEKRVLEYGSGFSTLFWASRCRKLVSVEHDPAWHARISERLPASVDYLLRPDKEDYVSVFAQYSQPFDIIIFDGTWRYECALASVGSLHDRGFIILDNSDWRHKTAAYLGTLGLIQVDMSGFGPMNGYTWTTSFYFKREVNLQRAHERQPMWGIGALHNCSE